MIATIPSAVVLGVEGRRVSVEVHVSNGLPGFTIVGLPDAAVRESRDRVRAALLSSGLPWPQRRTTVNLAPSGVRKGGAGLDLPIAVGLLVASGTLPGSEVEGLAFCGELGLDGSLRGVPGTLALREALRPLAVVVPPDVAGEAATVEARAVRTASSLAALIDQLQGRRPWPRVTAGRRRATTVADAAAVRAEAEPDLADVRGQRAARRAAEVAAAGGHHLLMVGPPGSGKTMLALRLPGLLPDLDDTGTTAVSRIRSAAGLPIADSRRPPFRAPHHSTSAVSMLGGGTAGLRPGELSLAHRGVLFLDELGEFPPSVLDALRQPLEEGVIRVSRARGCIEYPARFLLVAAMNPCPCGSGGPPGACRCTESARARYARRVSGPLLDRFDMIVRVDRPDVAALLHGPDPEGTATVAARVAAARIRAAQRGSPTNAEIPSADLARLAPLPPDAEALLERQLRGGTLTARGHGRALRLARTLADLDGADGIGARHLAEALALRSDRGWLHSEGWR